MPGKARKASTARQLSKDTKAPPKQPTEAATQLQAHTKATANRPPTPPATKTTNRQRTTQEREQPNHQPRGARRDRQGAQTAGAQRPGPTGEDKARAKPVGWARPQPCQPCLPQAALFCLKDRDVITHYLGSIAFVQSSQG